MLLDNGRTATLADPRRAQRAALHPLLGLPQRLPRLRAHRRARLRLDLSRPDRRRALAAADRRAATTPRCRSRRRCAAPATTCARWRSTSRRCSCTCARGWTTPRARTPERAAMPRSPPGPCARPRRWRLALRLAAARPAVRPPRAYPAAAAAAGSGWTRSRDLPAPPREPLRVWWQRRGKAVSGARDEILGRIRTALGRPAAADVAVPRDYRGAGGTPHRRPGRPVRRAGRRLPRRRAPLRPADAAARSRARCATRGARRVVVPAGFPTTCWPASAATSRPSPTTRR